MPLRDVSPEEGKAPHSGWSFPRHDLSMGSMFSFQDVLGLLEEHKYTAMFGVLLLCGLGLPLPEEITLIASGLAVGWEKAGFWWASMACVLGILAGDSIVFLLGRLLGKRFLASGPMRWVFSKRRQRRIEHLFHRHGRKTIFFARFLAGVRIGVYAYAGQHGMSFTRFLFLDLLGALISGPTSIWLGAFAARQIADPEDAERLAREYVHRGSVWVWAFLGTLLLLVLGHWWWNHRRGKRAQFAEQKVSGSPPEGAPSGPSAPEHKPDPEALQDVAPRSPGA